MSANLEAKKQVVEEIKQKIQNSKSVVFVDYKGLTVAEVSDLRNKVRAAGVEYKVYKNTLVRKAFDGMEVKDFDADLNGPTAVAFAEDETSACKILTAELGENVGDYAALSVAQYELGKAQARVGR